MKRKADDSSLSPPRPPLGAGGLGLSPPRPPLGAKKRRQTVRGPGRAVVQPPPDPPISAFPFFPDSHIGRDFSVFPGLVSSVYDQKGESCASVAFCRLLQAHYNRHREMKSHRFFSIEDLSDSLKKKTGKLSITNINHVSKLILKPGLLTSYPGREKQPDKVHGHRIGGRFTEEKLASRHRVFQLIQEGDIPFAIAIEATDIFKRLSLQDGIYKVPLDRVERGSSDHLLVVYGWGRCTRTGREFVIVQNSWGLDWGNEGYARLDLDDEGKFDVFQVTESFKMK